ncbi:Ig-like domain-containing protein [Aquiflexum balticum DSM 16537]|uniref:Ig-like domain-containing protein n=1 Tax=Aquiflexum balticum DSM 16537 TaxID=758820 RepID=A0A1W2H0Q8_9BACT|nr:Ig-like domain-containing domain [Aquiflexum balticum]SMD42510.1 Ig-like domain-containing protein [Aquiflexum balticum DSM 16537]
MRLYNYIILIYIFLVIISCAKQSTPMGGPKDEDPPKLVAMIPESGSLNSKPKIIELEFDEYIKVENPNKQILITPRINKDEMEVSAVKNKVIIKLNQDLEDSTTYVFNFQKTIKDITENNVPENLKLVFSTGSQIDSLTFSGNVAYVFPQKDESMKDVLVGLYTLDDTLDILTGPPYYIGQTDSTGNFNLTNIRSGEYKAYAWHDSNNSLKAEEKLENYGFLGDTIRIFENISQAQFYLSKADLSEFKVNRASTAGTNFDIVLSKFPVEISIENEDLNKNLFFRQNEKTIRVYHKTLMNDSTAIKLNITDSVGYKIDTLIYAKFEESDRNKEKFEPSILAPKNFSKNLSLDIQFNKPLFEINYDSLIVKYDTASVIEIRKDWTYFKDSTTRTLLTIDIPIPDTIASETFTFLAADSSFTDIEGLFNEAKLESSYKRLKSEALAEDITVIINTEELPIIVQITDKQNKVIAENYLTETNQTIFKNIEPGVHFIRAIIDRNKNKRWDTSNLRNNLQSEPVYYLLNENDNNSKDTTIRAGWALEVTIQPNNPVGIQTNSIQKDRNEKINQENNVDK